VLFFIYLGGADNSAEAKQISDQWNDYDTEESGSDIVVVFEDINRVAHYFLRIYLPVLLPFWA